MKIKLSGWVGRSHQINNAELGLQVGQSPADKTLRKMFHRPAGGLSALLTRAPGGSVGIALGGRSGRIESGQIRTLLRGARPAASGASQTIRPPGPAELPATPHPAPVPPTRDQQAETLILASLPGGSAALLEGRQSDELRQQLRQSGEAIVALARALQGAGREAPADPDPEVLRALVDRLCAGPPRKLVVSGASGDAERFGASLAWVAEQARSIQAATDWPATGAGLIGMGPPDPLIDPLLESARARALTQVLVGAARMGLPVEDHRLPAEVMDQIHADVLAIVALERESAGATDRLGRALGQAGFGAGFRLSAFRLDAASVAAIRGNAVLGGDPAKVSLILGTCIAIERRIQSDPSIQRLEQALTSMRASIREQRDRLEVGAAREELSALKLERFKLEQLRREYEQDPAAQVNLVDLRAGIAQMPQLDERIDQLLARPDLQADAEYARQMRAIDRQLESLPRPPASGSDPAVPGGFTPAELDALGLKPAENAYELARILEVCQQFEQQGLRAPEQVAALLATAGLIGHALGGALAASSAPGVGNERLAQAIGEALRVKAAPPLVLPDDVAQLVAEGRHYDASRQASNQSKLGQQADDYQRRTERAADLAEALEALDSRREAARVSIQTHNDALRPGAAQRLDLERPCGLAISRALLQVQALFKEADDSGAPIDPRRLATLQRSLRGFEPGAFSRPRFGGRLPTEAQLREWAGDPRLISLADAVVLLREDAAHELSTLEKKFKQAALEMDRIIRQRAALMGPEVNARLNAGIRAAILARQAVAKVPLGSFRPADHFVAIETQLREWGIDTEGFAPEIRHQLAQSFGATEVALWAEESGIDVASMQPAGATEAAEASSRPMIDALELGSNIKYFGGSRWQASAGLRVGTFGGGARTQQSEVANLEIERGIEGYRLTLRAGREGLYGADASVSLSPGNVLLNVGGKLGVEASRSMIEGFRLRFADSDAGRAALTQLVDRLIQDPDSISASDMAAAKEIASSTRQKGGIKTMAQASAGLKSPSLTNGPAALNLQVGVRAQLGAGVTREKVTDVSLKERGFESSREYSIQASLGLQGSAKLRVGHGDATAEDTKGQAVDLNAEIRYKRILKGTFNNQGQLKNALLLKQARAGVASRSVIERLGGEALSQKLSQQPDRRAALEQMLEQVVGNDMIRIRYRLKAEINETIGRLRRQADRLEHELALDEARRAERARLVSSGERVNDPATSDTLDRSILAQRQELSALQAEVDRLLESDEHFEPDRISLMRFRDLSTYAATVPLFVYERGNYLDQQSTWNQIHLDLK